MAPVAEQPARRGRLLCWLRPLRVSVAGLAGLSLLLYVCVGTSVASTTSAQLRAELAYARCMRAHGVTNFPDPNSQGDFPPFRTGVSKQASEATQRACQHLLPAGYAGTGGRSPAQKVEFSLKVAQCLRTHGFPNFPDANSSGQFNFSGTGIDANSPHFQSTETACEKRARRALGIPGPK
jgi:hypothetical protein